MLQDIIKKKQRKVFKKELVKGAKIFMNKKKTNSINMLKGSVEIFLKKEKKRSINMVVNDIKFF